MSVNPTFFPLALDLLITHHLRVGLPRAATIGGCRLKCVKLTIGERPSPWLGTSSTQSTCALAISEDRRPSFIGISRRLGCARILVYSNRFRSERPSPWLGTSSTQSTCALAISEDRRPSFIGISRRLGCARILVYSNRFTQTQNGTCYPRHQRGTAPAETAPANTVTSCGSRCNHRGRWLYG